MENITRRKILFVITQSEFGGAQHYVHEIARALNPSVYDVTVAAGPEGDDENGLLARLAKIGIKTRHLKYLRRAINPIFNTLAILELKKAIGQDKPDVLFLNSTMAGIIGSLAGRKYKIQNTKYKILYRIGGWVFNEDLPSWRKKLYLWLERRTAKMKDLIIVNSNIDRGLAIKLKIAGPEKIITIYNGLDFKNMKFLEPEAARLSLKVLVPSVPVKNESDDWWLSRKIIGTIANLYETKGLSYFIEAAALVRKNFPDTMFFIIGEGRERDRIEALRINNRLVDNLFLLGAVPSAAIFLKAFDIFVLPSVKEGMPWSILEAMAAGVPIVATAVGGVPEMINAIGEKSGILVPAKDSAALANAIMGLIKNPPEAQKMAVHASETLQSRFSLEQMLKKTEAALNP